MTPAEQALLELAKTLSPYEEPGQKLEGAQRALGREMLPPEFGATLRDLATRAKTLRQSAIEYADRFPVIGRELLQEIDRELRRD